LDIRKGKFEDAYHNILGPARIGDTMAVYRIWLDRRGRKGRVAVAPPFLFGN
jgi:hypothetical protein